MGEKENRSLNELAKKIPNHLIIEKALWVGDMRVCIDHIDNDLTKPLDYAKAFEKMIKITTGE